MFEPVESGELRAELGSDTFLQNIGEEVEEEDDDEEDENFALLSFSFNAFCKKLLDFCRIVPTLSLAKGIDSVEELLDTFTASGQFCSMKFSSFLFIGRVCVLWAIELVLRGLGCTTLCESSSFEARE